MLRNVVCGMAFAAAMTLLSACGGGGGGGGNAPGPTPTPSNPGSPNLIPVGGIYLGAFVNTGMTTPPPLAELTTFESQVGRTMALTQHYYGFYDTFPGAAEAQDIAAGRIPIDSWDCQPPNAGIAAGNQDGAIRRRADAFKAFGHPIFLRYMWEMNLPSTPSFRAACYQASTDASNGVFSPVEYIAAWDRIRAIFARESVTNVVWLWNPSGSNNPAPYYPGSSEVDWVGFDKYDDANISFSATYLQAYAQLSPLGKPLLVGETGAAPAIQAAFFAAAPSTLETQYPLIKGYVYFDAAGFTNNWRLAAEGTQAFTTMAADPYFAGHAP